MVTFLRCLSDVKNRSTQSSELQVKLSSLKRSIWTGVQTEEKGPLSWGISSFSMNSYFTDSEALLRCELFYKIEIFEAVLKIV